MTCRISNAFRTVRAFNFFCTFGFSGIFQCPRNHLIRGHAGCGRCRRRTDDHRANPAFLRCPELFRIAACRPGLLGQQPGGVRVADQGAVHLCVKGSLHGKDLAPGQARLPAGLQARLRGQDPGRHSGRIPQGFHKPAQFLAPGRHQDPAGQACQICAGLLDIIDKNTSVVCSLSAGFLCPARLPLQPQTGQTRLLAGGPDLRRHLLRMRVGRVDNTAKQAVPHQLCHRTLLQAACMDLQQRVRLHDLLPVLRRDADRTGDALRQKPLCDPSAFRRPSKDQHFPV